MGYDLGVKAIDQINKNVDKIARAAGIVGISVIGGLIATYISLNLTVSVPLSAGMSLDLQTELLDRVFPNILPVAYVGVLYYLLKKKNVSPSILIFGTFVVVLACSFIGVL